MKKKILKIFTILTIFCIIGGIIPYTEISAANNIVINGVDIGIAAGTHMQYTTSANGANSESGYYFRGTYLAASQCFGFARWCQLKIFGYHSGSSKNKFYELNVNGVSDISAGNLNVNNLKAMITSSIPGAHIRTHANSKGTSHSLVITNVTNDGFSIAQCNGSNNNEYSGYKKNYVGTYTYTWSSYVSSTYGQRGIDYIEMPKDYTPPIITEKPVDVGTDFCAYIINTKAGKPLSADSNNNVWMKDEPNCANQVWKFTRQNDGSYEIINCKTRLALDSGGSTDLKENLYTYDDCDNNCQRWYIFGEPGAYHFKSKYKDQVIDIAEGGTADGTNAQMFEYNGTTAQKFSIYKLEAWSELGFIEDVGTNFCAYIINTEAKKPLSADSNNNVLMKDEPNCANQVWKFTKQNDGSYEIINCKTGLALDAGGGTDLKENLYTYNDCDNDCQRWYIFGEPGAYYLKSKYKDHVIDIAEGSTADGTNAQMYNCNKSTAQKFTIYKLEAWSKLGCIADVGTDFYAYITNTEAKKHLTNESDNNVSIRNENGTANQIWKFTRQADGSYKIINCKTGRALDSGGGTELKENLYTYDDCDNDCQRWYIFGKPNAYYLKSKYKDHVIDISEGSTADGTNAQMFECNDTTAQKFSISKLDKPDLPAATPKVEDYSDDNGNNIKITWNACENATGYDIRIYDSKGEKTLYTYWNVQGTSYVTKLPAGNYQVGICSLNNKFNFWTGGKMVSFTAKDIPITTTTTTTTKITTNPTTTKSTGTTTKSQNTTTKPAGTTTKSTTTTTKITVTTTKTKNTTAKSTVTQTTSSDVTPIKTNVDLNGDGEINIADIVVFQSVALKKYNDIEYIVDLNGDGVMNVFDMIILKRAVLAKS